MTILAALNALGLTQITAMFTGMLTQVFAYLPSVAYALVLGIIAWIVARFLRAIVTKLLHGVGADKRVAEPAGMDRRRSPPRSARRFIGWCGFSSCR